MLKDRAKRKAKSRVKSTAKQKVRQSAAEDGGPKVLKAAVVGGTAYYAGKKIQDKRQEDQIGTIDPPPASDTETTAAAGGSDTIAQLQQLGQLRDQGILTEEEFEAQKKKVLGT